MRMELPKCVTFGELVGGAVSTKVQEKEWMGCLLDGLRAFGIKIDQGIITSQDTDEWCRVIHDKRDRGRESHGCSTACRSMPEHDGKS